MFGRKTARKRPKRDRIGFNATELVLAQDPRILYTSIYCISAQTDAYTLLLYILAVKRQF